MHLKASIHASKPKAMQSDNQKYTPTVDIHLGQQFTQRCCTSDGAGGSTTTSQGSTSSMLWPCIFGLHSVACKSSAQHCCTQVLPDAELRLDVDAGQPKPGAANKRKRIQEGSGPSSHHTRVSNHKDILPMTSPACRWWAGHSKYMCIPQHDWNLQVFATPLRSPVNQLRNDFTQVKQFRWCPHI